MMTLIILSLFLLYVIKQYINNKASLSVLFVWQILAVPITLPYIGQIDSLYIIDIVLLLVVALTPKREKRKNVLLKKYSVTVIFVAFIYLLAWCVFSRKDFNTTLMNIIGAIKLLLFMHLCWILNRNVSGIIIKDEIAKTVAIVVVINVVMVVYEMLDLSGSVKFLQNYILSEKEIGYLKSTVAWGYYARYYGMFPYPMHMGIFATMAIAYLLAENEYYTGIKRLVLIFCAIYIGLMSASKSFVFGISFVAFGYVIGECIGKKTIQKKFLFMFGSILVLTWLIINLDNIYVFVSDVFGSNIARYISFLRDFKQVFNTRFGENGLIKDTKEVAKQYWFLGVGPSGIRGERSIDSSYYIIRHNGGVVALTAVIIFYIQLIKSHIKEWSKLLLIATIIVTGMGFLTWISASISTWLIFELCLGERKKTI